MTSSLRTLSEICEHNVEQRDPRDTPSVDFRYIDIGSVNSRTKQIASANLMKGALASVRARQVVRKGDVIVSTVRPNLNAVARVPQELDGAICSTGFCVLRGGPELVSEYLYAFVQSRRFVEGLVELVQGALYPAVTDRQVFGTKIPWVGPDSQIKIARRFAEFSEAQANARQAAKAQLQEVDYLTNSLISQSLKIGVRSISKLENALCEVKSGVGPSWKNFPVLGATRSGLAPAKERPGKHAERYKPVTAGTVFYNPMRILIGSIALVDDDDEPGITSPDYVVLKGKSGVTDSRWFYFWLRSPLGERCIQSLARGAVRERMLFNRLAEGDIELPDYDTQLKTSAALAQIRPMRAAIQKQAEELELLPQKLLAQVFES
jgi:type I restriction enzyme S subunit